MASYNKFHQFVEDLAEKVHNLGSDTLKVALFNTSPNAADTRYNADAGPPAQLQSTSNANEIAAGNGYTAGGSQATQVSSAQTNGTYKLVLNDVVFTASGGSIGPLRYAVLYNASGGTSASRPVIAWWDYGSSITLNAGETLTIDFDATNGVLQIS